MSMSIWIIVSWVFVALFTAVNVFVFLKLKQASQQMMKMAFPGAKNMNEAMGQMQQMMSGMGGRGGAPGANPFASAPGKTPTLRGFGSPTKKIPPSGGKNMDAQLKAAMEMLQKSKKS